MKVTKELLDLIKNKGEYVKGVYEYDTKCWKCGSRNLTDPDTYYYQGIYIWQYDCKDCGCEMDNEGGFPPELTFVSSILDEYEKEYGERYKF